MVRVSLRGGYNVVSADGGALRRVLEVLWRPEAPADPALAAGATPARAGLTLVGNDRVTWRLVRDLAGPSMLQRYDPEKRSFATVAQEPARIAAILRDEAGVPPAERLGGWLALSASD